MCTKNEVSPSYASQSYQNVKYGAEFVIDGILNSGMNSTNIQSTGYSRDRKWLIIDYSGDREFNQVVIHTRQDTCQRCYSRITVQLLGDKGGEGGWCKFEKTGKYSTPPKLVVDGGEKLTFDCGAQIGRYCMV